MVIYFIYIWIVYAKMIWPKFHILVAKFNNIVKLINLSIVKCSIFSIWYSSNVLECKDIGTKGSAA